MPSQSLQVGLAVLGSAWQCLSALIGSCRRGGEGVFPQMVVSSAQLLTECASLEQRQSVDQLSQFPAHDSLSITGRGVHGHINSLYTGDSFLSNYL